MPDAWHQPDAEAQVLGALLLDPAKMATIQRLLPEPNCFSAAEFRQLYAAMLRLTERRLSIEPVSLTAELRALGDGDHAARLCGQLLDAAVTSAHAEQHASFVRDAWQRRTLAALGHQLATRSGDATLATSDLASDCAANIARLLGGLQAQRSTGAVLYDLLETTEREARAGRSLRGVSSGFATLDELTDGWTPGSLNVVAARPSRGKTSLMLHCALAAAQTGGWVYYASLEMGQEELLERMLASQVGVSLRWLRRHPDMLDHYAGKLQAAAGSLAKLPVLIQTTAGTPAQIRLDLLAEAAQRQSAPAVVFIDYLGLLRPDGRAASRNDEIGAMTAALKALAREIPAPVVVGCQLSRLTEREGRRPVLSDLRDSGNIEQDSDRVLFLHWSADPMPNLPATVDVLIAKNRNGPTGTIQLHFEPWTQRWGTPT
jgi:replicative DNA helicase